MAFYIEAFHNLVWRRHRFLCLTQTQLPLFLDSELLSTMHIMTFLQEGFQKFKITKKESFYYTCLLNWSILPVAKRRAVEQKRALFIWKHWQLRCSHLLLSEGKREMKIDTEPYFKFNHVTLTLKLASLYFLAHVFVSLPRSNIRSIAEKVQFKIHSWYLHKCQKISRGNNMIHD